MRAMLLVSAIIVAADQAVAGTMWFPFSSSRSVTCDIGCYPGHNGKDYGCPDGTKLYSPISGTVTKVVDGISGQVCNDATKALGNYIEVTNASIRVRLCHMQNASIPWRLADEVDAGEFCGKASNTGLTKTYNQDRVLQCGIGGAYHLHLETLVKNSKGQWVYVNPDSYDGGMWTDPLMYGSDTPTYSATYLSQNFTDPPADPSVSTRVQGDLTPIHCQVKFTVGENQTWTRQDVKLMVVNPDGTLRTDWSTFQFGKANLTHCA